MTGPILKLLQQRFMELGPLAEQSGGAGSWRHWRLARDDRKIAWLLFDRQDASVNVLSESVLLELAEILAQLAENPPHGLVLRSAKASGFCAGADLNEFTDLDEAEAILAKLQAAHAVADRLEALPFPTVAILHGSCLGGGVELALCCQLRLALPDLKLGLPEVRLGLHPGLGGTARLTHLIDPIEAMTLMLTGRTLDARQAKKAGVVDRVIEERQLQQALRAAFAGRIEQRGVGLKGKLLTTSAARRLAARQMRAQSAKKARPEHYPAPGALIDLWEEAGGDPVAMRQAEMKSFSQLLTSATARGLLRVFFLREKLKKSAGAGGRTIGQVHVIGAGAMGGDIAGWCAIQGLRATLYDRDPAAVAAAVRRTAEVCRARHLGAAETREVLDRLIPDLRNQGIARADLVIEAVPEKIEIKREVYREVEPLLKPGALLATNTSSIPLEELRADLADPGRFVGLHFFNPVARMQLVEVVAPEAVAPATLEVARSFVNQIGRLPVTVASAPGFLVNRVLMPYLMEAIVLLDEGVAAEIIDRAAEDFGMPLGPVELADQVGLDICLDVAEMLEKRLDRPLAAIPDWFREKVEQGKLGRKSGEGFYLWKEGRPQKKTIDSTDNDDLADRLLLPMLNACMTCLREGVVADAELLDGALVFGTGFAPFRGGPLHYARQRGFAEIAGVLEALAARHGERFTPDPGWVQES
ncbi:3-hydroxyacyl-CoA dehydrogenase NAD-binding domain-containing protein [Desulfuromonas carbonis]|uniref:3-hydroxyacyl-CoA dehydrogenase NAD-binding domain-containing protein n=1 Tax=Desulfuromonas sp. DDH964 TaxID=1823759 RepID=UPI00078EAFCA|nr:3-hydroxyacyl-CoA dehydrogenase NAD-binding domain-containing protein [Desulfuromonas sp. DDH964]AMV72728.1 enoyl-CoA hydratase/isomerase [Desulfuromonas sp. DDH964]